MKKLEIILLILLTTLLIFWINSASTADIPKEFSMVNISDIEMTLSYPAPIGKYVLYNVGNGWIVLNSMFFSDIHLKLAECDEKRKIVDPVIEKIIKPPVAWYQEKDIVLVGVPLIFIAGLISGVYITR